MPHIKLEYSSNLKEEINTYTFFSSCHQIVVKTLNADISRCQSRAQAFNQFHIAQGLECEAFVYLEIKILEGRSQDQLNELGKQLSEFLKSYFLQSLKELHIQISIRITEFPASHYFRLL